jgi:homoserine O-succinyltransferase
MPITIPDLLPAKQILEDEHIFVMTNSAATKQDIRPLRIAILNLMPLKVATEIHLLRLLANNPLQIEIDLVITDSYKPKTTPDSHLRSFYKTFTQIQSETYDGMIITGAPVEHIEFEEVLYWEEMKNIMEWTKQHVTSVLYICWAAQAGVYYHYGVQKYNLQDKMFGVFEHHVLDRKQPIVRGFDDVFMAPHSRYTEIRKQDIDSIPELDVICLGEKAGVYLAIDSIHRRIFVTGHSEYDPLTLRDEYFRDINKGININKPINYFPDDDPSQYPVVRWRSHANLLFSNWLNYYVYQQTPYIIQQIKFNT